MSFSVDSQYQSSDLEFSQNNSTSSADFPHWQILRTKKRLLPLNPAKILEEGEGNKGTEWTPDWFSPHELHDFVVYQWYTNCNQNTSLRKHQIEIAWPKAIHLPLFLATKRPPSWVASAVVPANQIPRKPLAQSSPVPLASSGIWSFWSTKSQKRMKIYLNKHLILEDIG